MKRAMTAIGALIMAAATAPLAEAQTIGATVGTNQTVTNSANLTGPNAVDFGIEFTGNGGTFTNTGSIEATSRIAAGPTLSSNGNIPFSNLTINNSGLLQQDNTFCCSGMFFSNSVPPPLTGTPVSNIIINNLLGGSIVSLENQPNNDSRPISFENGVNGATVNNAGTISTAGSGSVASAGIHVGNNASNVQINNFTTGVIRSTGASPAIAINDIASNVSVTNAGTITGGTTFGAINIRDANLTGVVVTNQSTGIIDGTASGVAINNDTSISHATALIKNSGTIKGNILFGTFGDTLLMLGGTVQTPMLTVARGGNLVGDGSIQGSVNAIQNSSVRPDLNSLKIGGNFSETGGNLMFQINNSPSPGRFINSSLILATSSNTVTLQGVKIELVFSPGTSLAAFEQAGLLDLGTFFQFGDPMALPLNEFLLTGDTFEADVDGAIIPLALNSDGSFSPASVPEPASLALFAAALGGLGWLRRRGAKLLLAPVLMLALFAMSKGAAAAPILLNVTVNQEMDQNLVGGQIIVSQPAFSQSFQLSLDPDLTIISTMAPQTNGAVTRADAVFAAPSISSTPLTSTLLAINTLGAPTATGGGSRAASSFEAGSTPSSIRVSTFEKSLGVHSGVDAKGNFSDFNYQLRIIASIQDNTFQSAGDVLQPTAQDLLDVLTHASTIQFAEDAVESSHNSASIADTAFTSISFNGTATIVALDSIPEPASLALFAAALGGLGWLRRRASNGS